MQYTQWHRQTVKKIGPKADWQRFLEVTVFGGIIFGLFYGYTTWMGIPGVVNKTMADTSVILMGLSMLLSSICYFWNFADTLIVYRKHLGLVGFGFSVVHGLLSWEALPQLLDAQAWASGAVKPVLAGALGFSIFLIMALISNQVAAHKLGGIWWRRILRTGYLALFFTLLHVFWLKSARWITWFQDGMERPPSLSLVVSIFIGVVLISRLLLWAALLRKKPQLG